MSRADTLKEIADYFSGLATLFETLAADSASASVSAARPAPVQSPPAGAGQFDSADYAELPTSEFADALPARPEPVGDQGGDAICPKHKKPYTEGKYGPYCTSTSDDPAWSNKRGYCSITPKSAATYLRVKAAA